MAIFYLSLEWVLITRGLADVRASDVDGVPPCGFALCVWGVGRRRGRTAVGDGAVGIVAPG